MFPWLLKNPALSAALGGCLVLVAMLGVSRVQLAGARADGATAAKAYAELAFDNAKAALASERAARATEQRQREALAGVAAIYEQERKDAEAGAARFAAGLRDGSIRMQHHWAGCETLRLSADAAAAGEAAEQDRLRRESLQRVRGWVGELQRERNECIDGWASQSAVRVMQGAGQ